MTFKARYKNVVVLILLVCFSFSVNGQLTIKQQLKNQQDELNKKQTTSFLVAEDKEVLTDAVALAQLTDYKVYSLDVSAVRHLSKIKDDQLRLEVPFGGQVIVLNLVKADIFAPDFRVKRASNLDAEVPYNFGAHYWGAVEGDDQSMVTISIFKDKITGIISFRGADYNLGKLDNSDYYVLFADNSVTSAPNAVCLADEIDQFSSNSGVKGNVQRMDESNCVGIYMETAYDMFQELGTVTDVTDFVTSVFTEVAALYTNESINVYINELVVWDVSDPYAGGSPGNFLNQFMGELNGTFNGDLAHLLSFDVLGGVAYLDVICNNSLGYGFSGIADSYNNVPAYSWTVEVITHELGHNLGSPHTHACAWNGNNTAIDGCGPEAGYSEGCDADLPDAGTIMSYCHLVSGVGIDFNLGFGMQPGDLIRDEVYNASCLTTCVDCDTVGDPCDDGDDCTVGDAINALCECAGVYTDADNDGLCVGDDPDDMDPCVPVECPPCTEVTLTIVLDNYPEETTWEIKDDSGTTVASGGAYGSQPDGSTVVEMECLIDGCYDFIIYDSYGDGICCGYGIGNYELTDANGNVLASGGEFGSSETTNFCVMVDVGCEDEGLPCDDGDICTEGETYNADCECTGGVFQDADEDGTCDAEDACPESPEPGASCDDGDVCTVDDVINENCECAGTYVDADNDGFCVGDDPDDNDVCVPEPNDPSCEPVDCTEQLASDFEPNWQGWIDGGSDARRSTNDAAYAYSGTRCVRLRDDSESSTITSPSMNFEVNTEAKIHFTYVGSNMETGEGFALDISIDGGSNFSVLQEWVVDVDFQNEVREFETSSYTGELSNDVVVRFRCQGSNNADYVYIDDVSIEGCGFNEGCATVESNDFSSWGIWNDAGSDARRSIQDAAYANSGDRCVRLRDGSSTSNTYTDNMDLEQFSTGTFSFNFISVGMDAGESLSMEMSTDGGSNFTTVAEWFVDTDFTNEVREFVSANLSGPFSSTTQLRIRNHGSDNLDYVYLDDVSLEMCGTEEPSVQEINTDVRNKSLSMLDFEMYPNPSTSSNDVTFTIKSNDDQVRLSIFDMYGKVVRSVVVGKDAYAAYKISTRDYDVGSYLVRIDSEQSFAVKKMIVIK